MAAPGKSTAGPRCHRLRACAVLVTRLPGFMVWRVSVWLLGGRHVSGPEGGMEESLRDEE
jgi:hypothetical protein